LSVLKKHEPNVDPLSSYFQGTVSQPKGKKQNWDESIPCHLEPVESLRFEGLDGSFKEYKRNWLRLSKKFMNF
jgi:hypothetical protein